MPARPRKSSAGVTLVLLGAATLVACGENQDTLRRDVYTSKDDCLKDWGDELKCEQQPAAGRMGGGHGGYYYYGPAYRSGQYGSSSQTHPAGTVEAPRLGSHAVATGHISR